ncbi:MAG: polyphosphate polymerase domain-containing protein, partial [Clostridia bacterium]|nr:polyphosphate polymerase domain-containing protein [Clostridia bacterium]
MAGYKNVFKRVEKKYKLTRQQYDKLMPLLEQHMKIDDYGKTTICNIYFDTDDFRIIRSSIEKPAYKEKLRLRSYNVPESDSRVFVEIKKKVNGVVHKRRIAMTYNEAVEFLVERKHDENSQIAAEINYFLDFYGAKPKVALFYDRIAMFGKDDPELRVTIDSNLKWRTDDIDLRLGSHGNYIVDESFCIMEIKISDAMPMWLSSILSE